MKVALIGCGFFAQNHIHAWQQIDGVELVALCDLDQTQLQTTATTFGIERTYQDAERLFSDGDFDVVDIATTVSSHLKLVELAANHTVHVICQKPFALNLTDAHTMVKAVQATGKLLMVHENFRWQSAIRETINTVKSGLIGEPFFGRISFRSGYDVFSGQPYLAEGERFIIEDLGIHILDISRALFGDVTHLSANTRRVNPAINGEDVATMMLKHRDGVTSVVDCSYATKRTPETFPESLIEVDGTRGTLTLEAGYRLEVQSEENTKISELDPPLLEWAERPWHNIQRSVLTIQQHFVDCVRQGQEPETSGADNLKTFALVEAAYRAASEHVVINMEAL